MSFTPFELLAGLSLDLLLGDPRWLPHPVRIIGWFAKQAERFWRRLRFLPLYLSGFLFWVTVVGAATAAVWLTLPWLNIYWIYAFIAVRSLDAEAFRVVRFLQAGDLESARRQLSTIVGRDTADLEEPEILRAVIETVSENLCDGIVAPLFFLVLGGPAAMAAYKAINTLDSMVGYHNERYERFGWAAARLDDVANFLPSRLTALLVWASAAVLWMNVGRAVKVTIRDAAAHPSPNAGYPESAFAGALGIQLGGRDSYNGVESEKPYMGDPVQPITRETFEYARALMFVATFWMALLSILVVGW